MASSLTKITETDERQPPTSTLVIEGEAIHSDDPDSPQTSNNDNNTGPQECDKPTTTNTVTVKKGKKKVAVQPQKQRITRSAKTAVTRKRRLRKRKPASKGNQDAKSKEPSPVALLDMLAEVASATLKNDPTIQSQIRSSPRACVKAKKNLAAKQNSKIIKNLQRRSPQSEVLNLDQIRMLSDKLLLNMFAELTADEIRRNYAYVCYLIPEKCQQKYTSFGNETKARLQMKTHLLGHIAELLAESNATGRSLRLKFTAEPVIARKKRLAIEQEVNRKQKMIRKLPVKSEKGSAKGAAVKSKEQSGAGGSKSNADEKSTTSSSSNVQNVEEDKDFTKIRTTNEGKTNFEMNNDESQKGENVNADNDTEKVGDENDMCSKADATQQVFPDKSNQSKLKSVEDIEEMESIDNISRLEDGNEGILIKEEIVEAPGETVEIRDLTEVASEVIAYEQPYHDHCYTTLEGRKRPSSDLNDDYDGVVDDGNDDNFSGYSEERIADGEKPKKLKTYESQNSDDISAQGVSAPMLLSTDADTSRAIESVAQLKARQSENIIRQYEVLCALQTLQKPKKQLSQTRIGENDAIQNLEDDDEDIGSLDDDIECAKKAGDKGSSDWERKLALKCIRLLRTKKKDERVALVCKICKDKTFTAQATLMYHYRSHAGIKPFVCNICNTTFTRQHSLNYHMLIHNNKSRFTCSDCGRKFRHPSHFKEHMRRHTGETPFECGDCGVRFKTRNTYKRHLKTRHGKLLTVNGIVTLSAEEFLKVKTNPKRKPRPRKDKETQWPEVTASSPSPVGTMESETSSSNVAEFLNYDATRPVTMSENDVEDYMKEDDNNRLMVNDRVVTKTMSYVDITPGAMNTVQRSVEVNLGSDPILLKVPAEISSTHLQPGDGFAVESSGVVENEEIKIIVACPNDKNEGEVTEWITATPVEVYPASTADGIPKVIMQPIMNGLGCLLTVDSQ